MVRYRVYLRGLGFVKETTKKGERRIKMYTSKKSAERRFKLEKSRGFTGRIEKVFGKDFIKKGVRRSK